jgi:hypothetical protein
MSRPNRSVAILCIGIIALAAFLPGSAALEAALLEPQWVLLPDEVSVTVRRPITPCLEQPVPLLALLPSRAPPLLAA